MKPFYFLLLLIIFPLISASPIDDLDLTGAQKEGVCSSLNITAFECFIFWNALNDCNFEECGECDYAGLINESDCVRCNYSNLMNKSECEECEECGECKKCEIDTKFDEYTFWKNEGFDVMPVYLNGEFSNFRIVENSSSLPESSCTPEDLEAEYRRGREACESFNNPTTPTPKDDGTPLYIWIGLVLLGLFIAWKKGWILKKFEAVNGGGGFPPSPPSPTQPQSALPPGLSGFNTVGSLPDEPRREPF
jgi:hypothetical protein